MVFLTLFHLFDLENAPVKYFYIFQALLRHTTMLKNSSCLSIGRKGNPHNLKGYLSHFSNILYLAE